MFWKGGSGEAEDLGGKEAGVFQPPSCWLPRLRAAGLAVCTLLEELGCLLTDGSRDFSSIAAQR